MVPCSIGSAVGMQRTTLGRVLGHHHCCRLATALRCQLTAASQACPSLPMGPDICRQSTIAPICWHRGAHPPRGGRCRTGRRWFSVVETVRRLTAAVRQGCQLWGPSPFVAQATDRSLLRWRHNLVVAIRLEPAEERDTATAYGDSPTCRAANGMCSYYGTGTGIRAGNCTVTGMRAAT